MKVLAVNTIFQAAVANLNPATELKVDTKLTDSRGNVLRETTETRPIVDGVARGGVVLDGTNRLTELSDRDALAARLAAVTAHLQVFFDRHTDEQPPSFGNDRNAVIAHRLRVGAGDISIGLVGMYV